MSSSPAIKRLRSGGTFRARCSTRRTRTGRFSMPPNDATLLLLRKAAEDEALLDEVLDSSRVTDAIFGFHAQQATEKLLKAVLSDAGVLYPLTHRLAQLIDLIRDN